MADKPNYYEKISLHNKTPEEAEKINKLFEDNINIANKIASKYYRTKYWDYDEALQIARMGLWKACLIWNPEKYRISTLAYNIRNRDFMDYDTKQKKQPEILFHMEENCVTDDLTLGDVLEDEHSDISKNYEEDQTYYDCLSCCSFRNGINGLFGLLYDSHIKQISRHESGHAGLYAYQRRRVYDVQRLGYAGGMDGLQLFRVHRQRRRPSVGRPRQRY